MSARGGYFDEVIPAIQPSVMIDGGGLPNEVAPVSIYSGNVPIALETRPPKKVKRNISDEEHCRGMKGSRSECEMHPDKCSFFHGYCRTHGGAAAIYATMNAVNPMTEPPPHVAQSALDIDDKIRHCQDECVEIRKRKAPRSYTQAEMAVFNFQKSNDLEQKVVECTELEKQRQVLELNKCKRMIPKQIQNECGEILCGNKNGYRVEECAKKLCHMQNDNEKKKEKGCSRFNDHCTLYDKSCQSHREAAISYVQARQARLKLKGPKGPKEPPVNKPHISERILADVMERRK